MLFQLFSVPLHSQTPRGGAVVARWAHNPKVVGSSPAPATKTKGRNSDPFFVSTPPPSLMSASRKYSEDTKLFRNSAKGIYLLEIKMVREFTSFLGNGLATVQFAVVCIALPVRVTLIRMQRYSFSSDLKIYRIIFVLKVNKFIYLQYFIGIPWAKDFNCYTTKCS